VMGFAALYPSYKTPRGIINSLLVFRVGVRDAGAVARDLDRLDPRCPR
jgi:hypothetical protein